MSSCWQLSTRLAARIQCQPAYPKGAALVLCLFAAMAAQVGAQNPRQQSSRRSGEVITRPDTKGGFPVDRLEVGRPAPPFTLPLLDAEDKADKEVSLAQLHAKKPVVLIFGSFTCPPFKEQLKPISEVYEAFRDRAEFVFVYVREAHPDSVLYVRDEKAEEKLQKIPQPRTLAERTANAGICRRTLGLKLPMAIDQPDNAVQLAYAGWPNKMVVVGTDGNILFKSVTSPRGTNAARLREWLEANLR